GFDLPASTATGSPIGFCSVRATVLAPGEAGVGPAIFSRQEPLREGCWPERGGAAFSPEVFPSLPPPRGRPVPHAPRFAAAGEADGSEQEQERPELVLGALHEAREEGCLEPGAGGEGSRVADREEVLGDRGQIVPSAELAEGSGALEMGGDLARRVARTPGGGRGLLEGQEGGPGIVCGDRPVSLREPEVRRLPRAERGTKRRGGFFGRAHGGAFRDERAHSPDPARTGRRTG